MYTAAVLKPISAQLLRWIMKGTINLEADGFVLETAQGQQLPHHMTINLGPLDKSLNQRRILGGNATLIIRQLVYNQTLGVCATPVIRATVWNTYLPVQPIKSANLVPHITICIKPESKPKFSNQMLSTPSPHNIEVNLDQTYILEAIVSETP